MSAFPVNRKFLEKQNVLRIIMIKVDLVQGDSS
jgi:hypothetical protein